MAESTTNSNNSTERVTKSVNEGFKNFEKVGDKFYSLAKQTASQQIDVFDQTVDSVLNFQTELAKSSKLGWVENVTDANASIVRSLTKSASDAARTLVQ